MAGRRRASPGNAAPADLGRRKRILVTNDDGVFSEGIKLLVAALSEIAEVWTVAPEMEQSATGHSLTLHRPLRLRQLEERVYGVDGTPTDCVNLAILWLLRDNPPDLICSGINFGLNLGDDVTYSGTVSATFEGTLLGIPSVAFSQEVGPGFSFQPAATFARDMVSVLIAETLVPDLLLNVNFPLAPFHGVSLTKLGHRVYKQAVVEKVDPRGRKYYWIAGTPEWERAEGTDQAAVAGGRVSITPLHLDLTDYRGLVTHGPLGQRLAQLFPPVAVDDQGGEQANAPADVSGDVSG
jgi:5'-nucleotidase